jgi:two-component system chemotaxis response regulator CheY
MAIKKAVQGRCSKITVTAQAPPMFTKQVALIAEDSLQVQNIVMRILKYNLHFGHVLVACNGKQAMNFFEAEKVDWIISDWEMPTMGGHQFLETLRKHPRGRNVPFILMTSCADKHTLATAMAAGITDFVAKPFSPAILTQKIRRIAMAMEKRVALRIAPVVRCPARIAFANGARYEAELVNISASGCLLRTAPLNQGGTVCEAARLILKLESDIVDVNSTATRIAIDMDAPNNNVLVAFQFQAGGDAQRAIDLFIAKQQTQQADQMGDLGDLIG